MSIAGAPCRFYRQGHCANGSACRFSHVSNAPLQRTGVPCKFFVQGQCKNGLHCPFSHDVDTGRSTGPPRQYVEQPRGAMFPLGGGSTDPVPRYRAPIPAAPPAHGAHPSGPGIPDPMSAPGGGPSVLSNTYVPSSAPRGYGGGGGGSAAEAAVVDGLDADSAAFMRAMMQEGVDFGEDGMGGFGDGGPDLSEDPNQLCELHVDGQCSRTAEECFYVHGDVCPHCKLGILHPAYPEESAQHVLQCEVEMSIIDQLRASRGIECAICQECVVASGRKFGLLEGCNHPFCLDCIRSWRTTYDQSNNVVRACPVCRCHSYLVTPCAYMPQSDESKDAVVEAYKERLSTIPCKLYAGGEGKCPFGTSCFFLHQNKDGTEPEAPSIRKTVGEDGTIAVVGQVTLSDFLFSSMQRGQE